MTRLAVANAGNYIKSNRTAANGATAGPCGNKSFRRFR